MTETNSFENCNYCKFKDEKQKISDVDNLYFCNKSQMQFLGKHHEKFVCSCFRPDNEKVLREFTLLCEDLSDLKSLEKITHMLINWSYDFDIWMLSICKELGTLPDNKKYDKQINKTVFDFYKDVLDKLNINLDAVSWFLSKHENVVQLINLSNDEFFKEPMSAIVYYLICNSYDKEACENFPYLQVVMEKVYKDLGLQFHGEFWK